MQVAVVSRHEPLIQNTQFSLAERAELLCGPAFLAHLAVWRQALEAQRRDGVVPASYLVAMRSVVAREAASGAMDSDDSVAAAVAIAGVGGADAVHASGILLQELSALRITAAEILRIAVSLIAPSGAAPAQARLDLLSMSRSGTANERTTVRCLLGETYLARGGAPANEAIAFRLFMAAADEACPAAAAAHFHLGVWYAQEGTDADLLLAIHHLERGAEHGSAQCLRALSEVHRNGDTHYAQELLELADLTEGGSPPAHPVLHL
jgi:hypothetical protein